MHFLYPPGHFAYRSCFRGNYLSNNGGHILWMNITQTLSCELKTVKWVQRLKHGVMAKQIDWSNLLVVSLRHLCSYIGIEHIGVILAPFGSQWEQPKTWPQMGFKGPTDRSNCEGISHQDDAAQLDAV